MIGGDAETARHIAGGGIGMPETGRNEDSSGWSGLFGHSSRPTRRIPRAPEAEIVWKVAFCGHTLTDGKPYGECRILICKGVSLVVSAGQQMNLFIYLSD